MKNLIVIRHGNYDSKTGKLTDVGEKQMRKLGRFMKKNLDGNYYFGFSGATRAFQGSNMLINQLDHTKNYCGQWDDLLDEEDYLTLDKAIEIHRKVNTARALEIINLALLTHFSVATGYSTYFMQKEFGDIRGIDNVPKGKAVLIDLVKKDYDIIPY